MDTDAIGKMNDFGKRKIPFLFLIDSTGRRSTILPAEEAADHGIFFDIAGWRNCDPAQTGGDRISIIKQAIPYDRYLNAFTLIQKGLRNGETFLANLTFPAAVKTATGLEEIFRRATAHCRLYIKDSFVCFSPERFVSIRAGRIVSHPMKGTIDASLPDAGRRLLEDPKEKAEHATVVDLIRNDLSRVARRVRVARYRYLDRIETQEGAILQTSTEISGELPEDYPARIGEILFSLLPAGSITGAPKKRTVELLREAENYDRGWYTGVAGWFDGENLESAVLIRLIEQTEKGLIYYSGGGITLDSDPEKEYEEMLRKIYVPLS